MGASVALAARAVTVLPGGRGTCELKVRNTGTVVDEFTLEVLGDAAPWAHVEPARLSLFPGAEGTATVVFAPARQSSPAAGTYPFGVKATSREDPMGSAVDEGTVTLMRFDQGKVELSPHTSRARSGARHTLTFLNQGNAPVAAAVTAMDPDELLLFDVRPPSVDARPGGQATARIAVRPKKVFWRGPAQMRTFRVMVAPDGGAAMPADGVMMQQPLIPRIVWVLLALLIIAVPMVFVLCRGGVICDRPKVFTAIPAGLVGKNFDEAKAELEGAKLAASEVKKPSDQPAGTVLGTNPEAGKRVEEGRSVAVFVSAGAEQLQINPAVVGSTVDLAKQLLAGFMVAEMQVPDPSKPPGTVVAVQPPAGSMAARGSTVTLFVSGAGTGATQMTFAALPGGGAVTTPTPVPFVAAGGAILSAQLPPELASLAVPGCEQANVILNPPSGALTSPFARAGLPWDPTQCTNSPLVVQFTQPVDRVEFKLTGADTAYTMTLVEAGAATQVPGQSVGGSAKRCNAPGQTSIAMATLQLPDPTSSAITAINFGPSVTCP